MITESLSDLGGVLTHKIEWMIAGMIASLSGIAMPSVMPTASQSTLFKVSEFAVTIGDISVISGCFFAILIGGLSSVKIWYAIKEHKLSILLKEKELNDD